ncbi:MAG: hypothetical protein ACKVP7_10290 [Hyphomicrobiaceae bacterium]
MIKHTLTTIALAASTLALVSGSALAYDRNPVDRTQAWQQHEIDAARRNGSLTRREYYALQAEQARIAELERRAKADGYVNRREFREIREAQREAQNHIYAESHDRQVNWWRRWKSQHGY